MLKGIPVILYEPLQIGVDEFNAPIYQTTPVTVNNVLVAPTTSDDIPTVLDLDGKKALYTLAIPKGDNHVWENKDVEFFGARWHTVGFAYGGIEALIPLQWNKKIVVERYG